VGTGDLALFSRLVFWTFLDGGIGVAYPDDTDLGALDRPLCAVDVGYPLASVCKGRVLALKIRLVGGHMCAETYTTELP
jgi:hypothetical protein